MSVGKSSATAPPDPRTPDGTSGAGDRTDVGPGESRALGPEALKAYVHPLRLAILRYLHDHDFATATTLAAHLGESTGQTSYHLRQLAKHGIVEEAPGRGTGRERWWRQAAVSIDATTMLADPAATAAAGIALDAMVRERHETLAAWMARVTAPEDERWKGSAVHSQSTLVVTPDELAAINDELMAVVTRATDRFRSRHDGGAPDGAARVRIYVDGFPLLEDEPAGTPDPGVRGGDS